MAIDLTEANAYGTGRGEAFVWGENKALRGLQQQQQQEALRKQKEEADLADQLAKVSVEGVRDKDLPVIMKDYEEIKNTFAKMRGTTDRMERMKLQAQLNQQKTLLQQKTGVSKDAKAQIADGYKLRFAKPDDVSDNYGTLIKDLDNTSTFDDRFKDKAERFASGALAPKFDKLGFEKKVLDASIENIPESAVKKQDLGGGNMSYYTEKGVRLNPRALKENLINGIKADKGAMRMVKSLYGDLAIDQAVQKYAEDLYSNSKGRYDKFDRTGASVQNPIDKYNFYNYRRANPMTSSGSSDDDNVYYTNDFMDRVFKGARGEQGGAGSGEQLGAILDGKGFDKNWKLTEGSKTTQNKPYHVEKFVDAQGRPTGKIKITIAPREVTSTNADGEQTSKRVPQKFITINGNNEETDRSKLNAFLKEATGGSLGVKESQIRTNKASGKGSFTPQATAPAKNNNTVKTIKKSDIASKASAAGYSIAEYTKLLKDRGVKIQ